MQNHKNIHFIGIGGIGISSLAYLALQEGKTVSGSDVVGSALVDDLRASGADVTMGHAAENISAETELVIYSGAIDKKTNPEYQQARAMGVTVLSYFEALGQLTRTKKTIVVVGTHGKTTVTAMLGLALIGAGEDPTVIVGSKVREFGGRNISVGGSDLLVVEGCEYMRSFLNLEPFGVVFLNCEAEHLDYYKDEQDYKNAYTDLIRKIPEDGFLVANMDDENVREIAGNCAGDVVGVSANELKKIDFNLQVIGGYNKLNALHAYKAAVQLEADGKVVKRHLEEFKGTWRRQELKGEFNGALVIDDYGHHPTEVFVTLQAVKEHYGDRRVVCVFQPHQYSRTRLMVDQFAGAFKYADKVIVTDIYEARDSAEDKAAISAEKLVQVISGDSTSETVGEDSVSGPVGGEHADDSLIGHPDVVYGGNLDSTYELLEREVRTGDVVVTMGAGDITNLAERLVKN